ncbi:hypothetical protein VTK73DRAFT_8633 [Phialemonium thermophilum]|uniref:Xylanolytic transcriptional activator regulatory domain-containing protein n=1 Tax=Phialemonium thermophilum TaxID=223376 RepID=A0ABR3W7G1_9PEZI
MDLLVRPRRRSDREAGRPPGRRPAWWVAVARARLHAAHRRGDLVADALLQASRDCLQSYLEADLEEPDVGSLAVRYLHSNCLHAAGKPKFSWHIFGEAVRLAQVMQLHDEAAYEALPALEAELRRRAFWIVYLGDKSAALLNHRPITIHQYSFEAGITTSYPSGAEGEGTTAILPLPARPDLATTSAVSPPGPPHHHRSHHYDHHHPSLIVGFNANIRLWQSASDLLLALRLLRERQQQQQQQQQQHQQQQPPGVVSPVQHQQQQQHISPEDRSHINSLYVRFATCLDDLPPCLHARALLGPRDDPTTSSSSVPSPGGPRHHRQYVVQAANLQVTYHCLRMVITQRLEDHGYFLGGAGGGPDSVDMLVLRKTEIARDLLQIIRDAPFWALQVNGEPCVSGLLAVSSFPFVSFSLSLIFICLFYLALCSTLLYFIYLFSLFSFIFFIFFISFILC